MKKGISIFGVLRLAGAFVACAIGSGFATGQEIMQFFTGQGVLSIIGGIVNTVIFSVCGAIFMRHGYAHNLKTPKESMQFYFGKKFGKVVEIILQVFLFGVYVIMISGAGATLSEYFGLNPLIGRIVMSVLCLVTVILGLSKFTDILGFIGPVIIVLALGVGIFAIASNPGGILNAQETISKLDIKKTAGGWLWSSILYPGFNAVVVIFLTCAIGSEARSEKEAVAGGVLGGILFGVAALVMNLGLMAKIEEVWDKAVPTLFIAKEIAPVFATIFSVCICCGIFSTAVPMLWGEVRHFAEDRTWKAVLFAVGFAVVGFLLGLTDFKVLVNTIYPASGYVGVALILYIIIRDIIDAAKKPKEKRKERSGWNGSTQQYS